MHLQMGYERALGNSRNIGDKKNYIYKLLFGEVQNSLMREKRKVKFSADGFGLVAGDFLRRKNHFVAGIAVF